MSENRIFTIERIPNVESWYIFEYGHSSNLLAIKPCIENVLAYLAEYVSRTAERGKTYEVWHGNEIVN